MSNSKDGKNIDNTMDDDTIPDLSQALKQIDFDRKPEDYGVAVRSGRFSISKWGSLALELLTHPHDIDEVLKHYNLTRIQYSQLLDNPFFQEIMKEMQKSLPELAKNGAYQLTMHRLAEQGAHVLEDIMASGEDKNRLKAVELAARLANLDPIVQAKANERGAGNGISLQISFGGGMTQPNSFKAVKANIEEGEFEEYDE